MNEPIKFEFLVGNVNKVGNKHRDNNGNQHAQKYLLCFVIKHGHISNVLINNINRQHCPMMLEHLSLH